MLWHMCNGSILTHSFLLMSCHSSCEFARSLAGHSGRYCPLNPFETPKWHLSVWQQVGTEIGDMELVKTILLTGKIGKVDYHDG